MRYSQLLWEMKSFLGASEELPSIDQLKDELSTVYMEGGARINEELVKMGDPAFMDDLEALEIGLEKEYAAYDFYKRVADTVICSTNLQERRRGISTSCSGRLRYAMIFERIPQYSSDH